MSRPSKIFVLILAGSEAGALALARQRYPAYDLEVLSKAELRESGWKNRLRALRRCRGEALLIFTDSLAALHEPALLKCTTLVHRCRETILADSSGAFERITPLRILLSLPQTAAAFLLDSAVLLLAWIGLQLFRALPSPNRQPAPDNTGLDVAFLFPSPSGLEGPGGAFSHVTGFLSGLVQEGARAAVFSGRTFSAPCPVHAVTASPSRRFHLFREVSILSYNLRFALSVRKLLARQKPRFLYQRHGRFLFAGALLSRWMKIPLVLEYNGSEDWIARHWDPARFAPWLSLCERLSLNAASLVVVVSNALKQQLVESGVPARGIVVNPNAVDPAWFYPHCGGAQLRLELGLRQDDLVVCFTGTFSYWHGIAVLGRAIRSLLDVHPATSRLKFLLVGDGPLAPQLRGELQPYVQKGLVIFSGAVPHRAVRAYLDAADILVSPHVPMPGGTPFFGSPTKLFEYMAMGKAIAASALDQLADVLEHNVTALLVRPGDPADLAGAITQLAADPSFRTELGRNAREAALARHTWRRNARRVLDAFESAFCLSPKAELAAGIGAEPPPARATHLANQNP